MLGVNLIYQFFIHSELAPRLGPLEFVLNTPAHHRVHHASNEACLDKNYGGMLIIFDRLFGTFAAAPEHEPLRYGLVGGKPSFNPVRIAFGEWIAMLRDVRKAAGAGPSFARCSDHPARELRMRLTIYLPTNIPTPIASTLNNIAAVDSQPSQ